ncbi:MULTISPECIES: hypothetical protein [Streptomyces]|uniref:hypothetical protein n=1 Tax=Streptomyces TaxID=1883 RepID=UPI0004CCCC0C|nr:MULTISPECIES: hypothetical protein [Streptomyces]KOT51156.1 hypothetical protein ADK43_32695 [Streptomyces rimosus subsp. rimosus]
MSETIECRADRRGRGWTTRVPEYGVYGHGRTLKALRKDVEEGLALLDVTAEVTIVPTTPELEQLRAAEDARTAALAEAVRALALRRATLGDIALATGVPIRLVKQLLADSRNAAGASAPETTEGAEEPQRDGEDAPCGPQTSA